MSRAAAARDRRYYDPDIQTMPLERVRALQAERLARQLDRVWSAPVPVLPAQARSGGAARAPTCAGSTTCRASRRR